MNIKLISNLFLLNEKFRVVQSPEEAKWVINTIRENSRDGVPFFEISSILDLLRGENIYGSLMDPLGNTVLRRVKASDISRLFYHFGNKFEEDYLDSIISEKFLMLASFNTDDTAFIEIYDNDINEVVEKIKNEMEACKTKFIPGRSEFLKDINDQYVKLLSQVENNSYKKVVK